MGMIRVHMIPAAGVRVLYPAGHPRQGRALPAEGASVPLDNYWTRRELDGSVVRAAPPAAPAAPAAPTTEPEGEE